MSQLLMTAMSMESKCFATDEGWIIVYMRKIFRLLAVFSYEMRTWMYVSEKFR